MHTALWFQLEHFFFPGNRDSTFATLGQVILTDSQPFHPRSNMTAEAMARQDYKVEPTFHVEERFATICTARMPAELRKTIQRNVSFRTWSTKKIEAASEMCPYVS